MTEQPNDKIAAVNFGFMFGREPALKNNNLAVRKNEILSIIGPSRSGKTTFLRSLNRLNDLYLNGRRQGTILLDGQDIYEPDVDISALRRRVGMVYAVPIPLPMTIFDNLAFGPRRKGIRDRSRLLALAESSLKSAFLWNEVKDRLSSSALQLSGGQQQRLCLARVLMLEPEVLLLDEPCSGLDPISTSQIEEALQDLKKQYTIILVTNNVKQAARASDRTAFFLMGDMVELGETKSFFTNPRHTRTSDYITGKFG